MMSDNNDNNLLLNLKKENIGSIQIIDHQINSYDLESDLLGFDEKPNIHEITESSDTEVAKVPKKRGRKPKPGSDSESKRTFSFRWLCNPSLKDWLVPVPNKPTYVSCKWCKVFLRAHLNDLKKHSQCRKHHRQGLLQKSSNTLSFKSEQPNSTLNINDYLQVVQNEKHSQPSKSGFESSTKVETSDAGSSLTVGFQPSNIGFIGCGNMAQALISGFISNELVEPANVIVSAPSKKNLVKLKPLGIKTTHDNNCVVDQSDMVFLAVKPHIIPEVLGCLEPIEGSNHNPLFISVATGLNIARLEAMLSHVVPTPRLIRMMPNTPCMVLQGCCVFTLGTNVDSSEGKMLKCLLGSVGLCEEVPESQIDAICGVAGSGPAYIYAAIEAMADGGVKMGLPRNLAMAMAAQTVKGAATMVLETGKHPGQLKDEVCSPGGTTITAMHTLEKNGLRNALISAVEASANRSKELG